MSVVNFEGTLTEETSRADKTFAFKGPAKYTDILTGSSVEAANIANNHSKDYGTKSQEDTIENLSNAGIATFGYENVIVVDVKVLKSDLPVSMNLPSMSRKQRKSKKISRH